MTGTCLQLPALEVTQAPGLAIYLFAVDGKLLSQFTAVSHVHRDEASGALLGYQRWQVLRHVEEIRRYLDSPDAMLPNALTVAFDDRVRFEPLPVPAPVSYARFGLLLIPSAGADRGNKQPGWLVDGQQRAAAIARAARTSVPIAVAAFIDPDPARQREQFLRVNAVKPLPRSLLLELLPLTGGPLSAALERRRLPAVLAEQLNHDPRSPLYHMIRTPTNWGGVVADNSLLRALANSIEQGALHPYQCQRPGLLDTSGMIELVSNFWSAVRDVFPAAWALPPRKSRLLHGAGVLALGLLMDAIADGREQPPPSAAVFAEGLRCIARDCRWTSGTWAFGRPWNHIQNTGQDGRLLSDFLTRPAIRLISSITREGCRGRLR